MCGQGGVKGELNPNLTQKYLPFSLSSFLQHIFGLIQIYASKEERNGYYGKCQNHFHPRLLHSFPHASFLHGWKTGLKTVSILAFLKINFNTVFPDIQWSPWSFDICMKMWSTENLDLPISLELLVFLSLCFRSRWWPWPQRCYRHWWWFWR